MKIAPLFAAAALAAATAASAQPLQPNPPTTAIVCVDVSGALKPPVCNGPASRLDLRQDICLCRDSQRVEAPVCPPGVAPPPQSVAVDRARRAYLAQASDLLGATWEGRPMCVPGRQP
ncbi:MAG: hypothetical protein JWQ97_319 [Phenylobacterium sp.]|nr:hypothetical protein [Phenylobacterium sp.]